MFSCHSMQASIVKLFNISIDTYVYLYAHTTHHITHSNTHTLKQNCRRPHNRTEILAQKRTCDLKETGNGQGQDYIL